MRLYEGFMALYTILHLCLEDFCRVHVADQVVGSFGEVTQDWPDCHR
jgi:hypothetical protein